MYVRKTIRDMTQLAAARGGKCLSDTYVNAHTPLYWECKHGHRWRAVPNKIQQGRWCPMCASGLGERICRAFFEQLFRKRFPKLRPTWLKNQRGHQMELDGYCRSIGLAFEHQGRQHFTVDVHYMTDTTLQARREDDKHKRDLCIRHNVVLVQVPEIGRRFPIDKIRPFIRKECTSNGIHLPDDFDSRSIDLTQAYSTCGAHEYLKRLISIAKKHGGNCLSEIYKGSGVKLRWECAKGHHWEAVPDSILQGVWCPACAGVTKKSIKEIQQLAKKRRGQCLSDAYINAKTKLLWQCEQGHQWWALPRKIRQGTWCPYCAGTAKGNIEEMRKLAVARGGKCLSHTYVNSATKLLWQCKEGHQWKAPPSTVKAGQWCPVCGGSAKGSIDDMQKIATDRGGKCLSCTYVNNETKLLWECARGHRWEARPSGVKQGTWCPLCAGTAKHTIGDMQQIATERGGNCLSNAYVNANTKLLWRCKYGHQWEALPRRVTQGKWCPVCAKQSRPSNQ